MRLSQSSCFKALYEEAMTGFFPFAHHQRVSKNEMRKQLGVSADETYQSDFLEAAVLNYSAKGATTLRKE